ncbi:MAG: MltA domain-containing protein [bacterium]|nr:MltA domain-containing protein [bacterium]
MPAALTVALSGLIAFIALTTFSTPLGGRGPDEQAVAKKNTGSLIELSAAEVAALNFSDQDPGVRRDSDQESAAAKSGSIEAALHHSLAYYLDLPEDSVFRFGPDRKDQYSRAEMIASCSLFLKIVRRPQAKLRARELARRFRVFESRSARGDTLFTGYYTPRLRAATAARSPADVPVYGPPADLVRVDVRSFVPEYPGPPIFGRVQAGRLIRYFTQKEILLNGAIAANDPLFYLNAADFYHLQLQGGALITLPSDQKADAGKGKPASESRSDADSDKTQQATYYEYAADNGRDFQSPGKTFSAPRNTLRRRARENPRAFQTGLAKNPRYIFFRAQSHGPSGSLKTPLTPGRSIAMDTKLIRGGVPAFVMSSSRTHTVHRFAVVQDTGNAIRGHGRVDFYWGDDAAAESQATRFKQNGRVFLFVARK